MGGSIPPFFSYINIQMQGKMSSIRTETVFTKEQLQGMRAKVLEEEHENNVDRLVKEIRDTVVTAATCGEKRSYFHSVSLYLSSVNSIRTIATSKLSMEEKNERNKKIIDDTILILKQTFPGVIVGYITQKCIRTGKTINEGINIDWS